MRRRTWSITWGHFLCYLILLFFLDVLPLGNWRTRLLTIIYSFLVIKLLYFGTYWGIRSKFVLFLWILLRKRWFGMKWRPVSFIIVIPIPRRAYRVRWWIKLSTFRTIWSRRIFFSIKSVFLVDRLVILMVSSRTRWITRRYYFFGWRHSAISLF